MKKKIDSFRSHRKLQLAAETLRILADHDLAVARGGSLTDTLTVGSTSQDTKASDATTVISKTICP